ncbi:MAG TPA: amino acid adenylation domain-containing protein, partial [Dongiaceae bacterium]|nr:amino acid adenylation domain-containing protein [Dongiaceae bacterium]
SLVAPSVVEGVVARPAATLTLWQRLEFWRAQNSAAVAVFDTVTQTQLSWDQLLQQAEALAARLTQHGVDSGSRVGLWLSRSSHWPVACVACWRLNAAFVPLDRAAPPARTADILADAGIQWVIAVADDFIAPEGISVSVVTVEDETADAPAPAFTPDPDACAYLIYTSGSTGRPKGVAVAQCNLLAYADGFDSLCRAPARSCATLSPYTFDASIYELAGALLHGRELVILPDVLALDRDRWQSLLFVRTIDMLYVPPNLLDFLRESWAAVGTPPPTRIMTGVEPIAYATLWRWLELNPAMDILNQYGPTEATVAVTWYRVDADTLSARPTDRVPLGHAMPGARIELRDTLDRIVPRGCSGEAVVFGPQVGLGYVGHAAVGDQRFDRHVERGRFYRTGDWMRFDRDGHLLYQGRADHQIKLRGVRVELGEVRTALLDLPGVRAAWVEARRHDSGTPFLVGHVACDRTAVELMPELRQKLPPLLVPACLLVHTELPLNRHGKVDATALAALPLEQDGQERRPPQTDTEHALWNAWYQELPQAPQHVGENFYALGGHSLMAARIASRLLAAGYRVSVADLLTNPDIASQARTLTLAPRSDFRTRSTDAVAITGQVLPFQFTLWAHENVNGPSRAYTVPFACRFINAPTFELIEAQWARLMLRHEALRTCFVEVAAGLQQQVRQDWSLPLQRHRIDISDAGELPALTKRLSLDCLQEPLRLSAGEPLWRVHWFDFDGAGHGGGLMVALFHHSIFDGTSVQALAEEWQSSSQQHDLLLPAMVEAVTDIQQQLQPALESGLAFWRQALAGREMADLPRRESPLQTDEPALHCYSRPLTSDQYAQLQQVARKLGCSPFVVAFTLYQLVLARFSNHLNGAVAMPVDLRDAPHRLVVGGLVNTVSIPCVFDWNDSLADAIRKTGDFLRASQPYRAIPLDLVTQTFDGTAQQWLDTLFGSIFVWEEIPAGAGPLAVEWLRLHPVDPKTDIEFVVGADGIHLLWRSSRFEAVTMQSLLDCYAFVLDGCADALDKKMGYLPLFDAGAFESQVRALCGDVHFTPPEMSVLDLIEHRVQRQPDKLAVCRLQKGLTYAELRSLALDYADGLQRAGVVPRDRVAFCLDRTPETVALLLGIWQAGAAYVPIDPRWPADRRAQVLAAAGCRCLVVEDRVAGRSITQDPGVEPIEAATYALEGLPIFTRADLQGKWPGPDRLSLNDFSATAYVLFTSGSTGVPKGVVITHTNLAAFLRWISRYYPEQDFAGFLAVTTFAFDISVFELFGTLSSGGTLYLGEDPLALLDPAVREEYAGKLTFLCSVPSAAIAWLDAGVVPTGIRTVNMGGEFLPQAIVERFYDAGVGRVLDLWGPTEDTTYSMVAERTPGGRPHIGKPIDDTQMWVVDSRLQPQPRGVKGELMLGGLGLSAGYLNAPELTDRAFIANPFLAAFPHWAPRIYHSGDIGWQDANDDLHYCARADFQMKIRGQRLEAGEIETRLRQHPSVRTAVVLLHRVDEQTPFLLACIETEPGYEFDMATLADFVRQQLPPYMVPTQWLPVERWPLNANGKIDRRQLQNLAQRAELLSVQNLDDAQPLTPIEETLLEVGVATLGQKLSLTRPLDQAGIDSIALLKFSFALQKALALPQAIPLSVWLQQRTLRGVAAQLQHGFPLRTWTRLNDAPASAPVLACIHAVGGE